MECIIDKKDLLKWEEEGRGLGENFMMIFFDGKEYYPIFINNALEEEENLIYYSSIDLYVKTIDLNGQGTNI